MAKCGIRWRYPVKLVIVHDDGLSEDGPLIGEAETLGLAVALARREGFSVREAGDGGHSRLELPGDGSTPCFTVTVHPD